MSRFRTLFRRLRSIFWTALTLVTVLAAILVGIGKLLMPYSERYQPQLEAWLSQEFGQPVRIESFTGEWKAFGPRISLQGVTILGPDAVEGEIAIQHAALDVKPLNSLWPGRPLYTFHIIGADLALTQEPDGRWELSGLGVSGRRQADGEGGGAGLLEIVGQLRLENSRLSLSIPERDITAQFTAVHGRLQLNGPEIAAEIQANVTDADANRVLGELEATLLLRLNEDQRLTGARWHAKTRELMISELASRLPHHPLVPSDGRLNSEIWGEWDRDEGQSLEGVLDLRNAALPGEPDHLTVDHINTRFNWRMLSRKSWRLDFSEFRIEQAGTSWSSDRLTVERNIPGNLGLWVSADSLEVAFPLELTQRIMAVYQNAWPRNAPRRASGRMKGFDLVLDARWKLYKTAGEFENLSATDWGRWPDVAGLGGKVDLLAGTGQATFSGRNVRVDWPRNFRLPLVADFPSCTLDIGWGDRWQVHARDCMLENEMIRAFGRLNFARNEGKPAVDVNVVIDRARLAELDPYWPHALIKPRVSDWLGEGLLNGEVIAGQLSLRGDMDDWPFRGNEGHLEAIVEFEGLGLDYYPGWPQVTGASGSIGFRGESMRVEASLTDLSGNAVQRVTGQIRDLRAPVLEMSYASETTLPGLLRFIRETPLLGNTGIDPDQFSFTGNTDISGRLRIPLKANSGPIELEGEALLAGNGFSELRSGFALTGIRGVLSFDRDKLMGRGLSAFYRENESRLEIEAFWDDQPGFRSELTGIMPIGELLPETMRASEPLLDSIGGSAEVVAAIDIARGPRDSERDIWLEVNSNLVGVMIDLPAPLNKQDQAAWPLRLRYPIRSADTVTTVELGDRLVMAFDLADGFTRLNRAHFQLGGGPYELPAPGLFRLAGSVALLDIDAWVRQLTHRFEVKEGFGTLQMAPVVLRADRLLQLGREFTDVEMEIRHEDGILSGSFDSEGIAGGMRYLYPEDGPHSLTAQLDRLILPPPEGNGEPTDTDPSRLPEMHIYIDQFSYLGLDLGQTRIEGYPSGNGFRLASVEANSPDFTLNARGDWARDDSGERSDFDIVMTSESLGSLIDALEISSVLEGGQTVVRYDAWWPGPPAAFALARLNGEMDFSVIQGTIVNADAGAGRMVGLMSIAALPRRLAFDFRDVFGTGFIFDEAEGSVSLENGVAYTNDLVLKSTAATMEIKGSSNLEEQTFDYILSIKPGVGQTLPVLGAIAAGPGGAAAGLALQGLLQKSLGEAAEARYSITGPWSDPLVVRIPMESPPQTETANERLIKDS